MTLEDVAAQSICLNLLGKYFRDWRDFPIKPRIRNDWRLAESEAVVQAYLWHSFMPFQVINLKLRRIICYFSHFFLFFLCCVEMLTCARKMPNFRGDRNQTDRNHKKTREKGEKTVRTKPLTHSFIYSLFRWFFFFFFLIK